MKGWFQFLVALLVAGLALIAKLFKSRADRLEEEQRERDASEREYVARMGERRAGVLREQQKQPPPDPQKRTDFE